MRRTFTRSRSFAVLITAASTLALGLGVGGTAVAADRAAGTGSPGSPWGACPFPDSPAELQCASIQVPVDYAHPHGPTTTITVDRLPATGAHPVGSLFFDPGGPGGSGTSFVSAEAQGVSFFSAETRRNFDLIGVDPRGVGLSTPVRCDPALLNRPVRAFPRTEAEFRQLVRRNRELGLSCRKLIGPLLDHVDTVSAARDLEAFRKRLGISRINYLGLSYGSQLGATYAALFPSRSRTLALDGALDHSWSLTRLFRNEAAAYEDSFNRFAAWCDRTTDCALHGRDVGRIFDRLVASADHAPIPAPDCVQYGTCRTTVTGEDIRLNTQTLLLFKRPIQYVTDGWAGLAVALQKAENGDASALSTPFAATMADGTGDGSAIAIECLDWPTPARSLADLRRLQALGRSVAPRLGGASQSWTIIAGCIGWPAPVVNPPAPIRVRNAPPILITNATHDPSTAYAGALSLQRQLPTSVLVTREGDGHTSYLNPDPNPTRDAIDRYLLTARTPAPGTTYPDAP
jgi:pimeloyl-ACP methyl ester carboxylesterase